MSKDKCSVTTELNLSDLEREWAESHCEMIKATLETVIRNHITEEGVRGQAEQ